MLWLPASNHALYQMPGYWLSGRAGAMKKAVEQDTLQALVETGAAREFRVLRER